MRIDGLEIKTEYLTLWLFGGKVWYSEVLFFAFDVIYFVFPDPIQ
jgi:hypothetical protein